MAANAGGVVDESDEACLHILAAGFDVGADHRVGLPHVVGVGFCEGEAALGRRVGCRLEQFVSVDDAAKGRDGDLVGRSARDRALYVFLNRRRTLLKALFFDGSGYCVFYKRLDRGRFQLPQLVADSETPTVEMSEDELERLLDGMKPAVPLRGPVTPAVH